MTRTDAEWRALLAYHKLPPAPEGVVTSVRWIARDSGCYLRVGAQWHWLDPLNDVWKRTSFEP